MAIASGPVTVPSAGARGTGHKLEHRMFTLIIRKHLFTLWMTKKTILITWAQ